MLQLQFRFEDIEFFERQRFEHSHPWLQRKFEALYLKSHNLPHQTICKLCGICGNTLHRYLIEYQQGGLDRVQELPFHRPSSVLESHRSTLREEFAQRPVATVKEAAARIAKLTGVRLGPTQTRDWLHRLGLNWRKVAPIPAKADVAAQAEFKAQKLEPRLQEARAGRRVVYFMDAAHFVFGAFLGCLWSLTRVFVRTPSGRQRFNVLGALDALTHELITVTNETYINALSVCQLLWQLAEHAKGKAVTVVLDNARYQHCALVQTVAAELGIELLFLPPYSPNLNLIERLWKFVKKRCLNSTYHADFAAFRGAIADCVANVHSRHKEELDTLLTLKFQTFEKAQSMTA
jgi:transposase